MMQHSTHCSPQLASIINCPLKKTRKFWSLRAVNSLRSFQQIHSKHTITGQHWRKHFFVIPASLGYSISFLPPSGSLEKAVFSDKRPDCNKIFYILPLPLSQSTKCSHLQFSTGTFAFCYVPLLNTYSISVAIQYYPILSS